MELYVVHGTMQKIRDKLRLGFTEEVGVRSEAVYAECGLGLDAHEKGLDPGDGGA